MSNEFNFEDLTITLPFHKYLLYKINLPTDILKYIEKFLNVFMERQKLRNMLNELYNNTYPTPHIITNLNYIKKYEPDYKNYFGEFDYRDTCGYSWNEQRTLCDLFLKLFYINIASPLQTHQSIIDFLRSVILNSMYGMRKLVDDEIELTYVKCHNVLTFIHCNILCYDTKHYRETTNLLDSLFCIVFTPKYFIEDVGRDLIGYRKPFDDEVKKINIIPYMIFLKEVLLDRNYEIVVLNRDPINYDSGSNYGNYWRYYSTIDVLEIRCSEPKYEAPFFEILRLLRMWRDRSLYHHIANIMSKINNNGLTKESLCAHHLKKIKYIIKTIVNDYGYLLLDAMLTSKTIVILYSEIITEVLADIDLRNIKDLCTSSYENIKKLLISSDFMFVLVKKRKFKTVKFLFSTHKTQMAKFRNDKEQNLLEVACESKGLNQNIINLFLRSRLFISKNLVIKNKKVRSMYENV